MNSNDFINDSLLDCLILYAKLYAKPISKEALIHGIPIKEEVFSINESKSLFSRLAKRAGFKSTLVKKQLDEILNVHLPMILLLKNKECVILEKIENDKAKIIIPKDDGLSDWIDLKDLEKDYLGFGFLLKKEYEYSDKYNTLKIKNNHWFWDTLKLSLPLYRDVIIASILINLFVLAIPLFTMNVYDRVIPNNAQETLWGFTIGIVLALFIDFLLKNIRTYLLELAGKKSEIIMSSIIFEKAMNLKMSVYPKSVGSFANNLRSFDVIRNFFTSATISVLVDIPFSILFLFVIWYIGGVLVIVPIFFAILIILYALIIRKPLERLMNETHHAHSYKSAILIETLQNIETVKTQNLESLQQYKWEEATGNIAEKFLKTKILSASIPTVTYLMTQLNTVVTVVVGVYLITDHKLTMGALIAAIILGSRALSPIGQIAALISQYSDTKVAYEAINNIIKQEKEHDKEFLHIQDLKGIIEFQNVTFKYPNSEVLALDNVSFKIEPGEKVAIIGSIGSGKSTIVKLLMKLYEPQKGKILIDNLDISQIDPAIIRNLISYLPQDIHLFRGDAHSNITLGKKVDASKVVEASKISTAFNFISKHPLGFEMPIEERGLGLSGGQKQTIALARTILRDGKIFILDEPTSSLDKQTEKEVISNLKRFLKDKTLILITQNPALLSLVDRIIVLHNGKKIIDGKKEEVLAKLNKLRS